MVTKPTNAHKRIRVSYIIIILCLIYLVHNILTAISFHATIYNFIYQRINDLPYTRISFIVGW